MPQALTPNSPIPADEKRLSAYLFEDFFFYHFIKLIVGSKILMQMALLQSLIYFLSPHQTF